MPTSTMVRADPATGTGTDTDTEPPKPSQDTESFLRRLAGASVTKAGLVKDQTEINKIIAEVSKGSKFYENEKRKDKELTVRINKILKTRDDLLKTADMKKVEQEADRLFEQLEAERDLSQTIVHVDLDMFFASVELLHNPSLKGKPFGCGKGLLSTASYEARKYGVRSGMAEFVARALCPQLITVPVRGEAISEMSRKVMSVFKRYDPTMIVAGCDEGYLNITSYCAEHGMEPEDCVREMRAKVFEETGLTASAGIAPNKLLAKICSDKNKPNGQFALPFERDAIIAFMRDLSIRKIGGIGKVSERLLDSIGVKTCGDIYMHRATIVLLDHYFWKSFLFSVRLGIGSNVVEPHLREERKSIGAERTFRPITDHEKMIEKLEEIAAELEEDMKDTGWTGKTVTLKFKTDTFQVCTRAKSLNHWVTKKEELLGIGKELLKPELPLCIRLIGLRVTKLKDLRATETTGIKRFFQSGPTNTSGYRAAKRPRLEEAPIELSDDDENDQLDPEELTALQLPDFDIVESSIPTTSKPLSTSEHTAAHRLQPIAGPSKPSSARSVFQGHMLDDPAAQPSTEQDEDNTNITISCPICGKDFDAADNGTLNAHIDFCLSKETIKQATATVDSRNRAHALRPISDDEERDAFGKAGKKQKQTCVSKSKWECGASTATSPSSVERRPSAKRKGKR